MDYAKPLFHAVLLASLTLTACVSAPGEVEEQVGQAQQDALIGNALIGNALIGNALIGNALIGNALIGNALIGNALIGNDLTRAALTGDAPTNANAREVLSFIVGCALPADETLVYTVGGVTYSDPGALGLAPEWGQPGGQCDESCQQWVSACVISRVDYLGQHVEISVRGDHAGLGTTPAERADYTQDEATYYGDIFSSPQSIYGCLAPGKTEIPRVCGPSIEGCVVDVLGSCTDLCGPAQPDGSFPNCQVPPSWGEHGWTPGAVYEGSITVFLQP